MRITEVKFYQGVNIDGRVETHAVNNAAKDTQSHIAKGISITETENGILLTKGKVATLATWNNVQYVKYDLTVEQKAPTKDSKINGSKV